MSKAFRVITARVKGGKVYIPRTYVFLQQETFLLKGSMLTTPQGKGHSNNNQRLLNTYYIDIYTYYIDIYLIYILIILN